MRPLAEAAGPLQRVAEQAGRLAPDPAAVGRTMALPLRPPGALLEQAFVETCSRCGKCVEVCPAQCIRIDPAGNKGRGAPYIEPNLMACVVCDGLYCMNECPSGALVPTPIGEIGMGTAVWREELCLRSKGEACTICVDHCPVGTVALELIEGRVCVHEDGCIGCGVCQHDCPTDPKSIVVIPRPEGGRA